MLFDSPHLPTSELFCSAWVACHPWRLPTSEPFNLGVMSFSTSTYDKLFYLDVTSSLASAYDWTLCSRCHFILDINLCLSHSVSVTLQFRFLHTSESFGLGLVLSLKSICVWASWSGVFFLFFFPFFFFFFSFSEKRLTSQQILDVYLRPTLWV